MFGICRRYCPVAAGLLFVVLARPSYAGLLVDLSRSLGLLPVLNSVSQISGLALDEAVLSLDAQLSGGAALALPEAPFDMGMSVQQRSDLASMDRPAVLLSGGEDQPALADVALLEAGYAAVYPQSSTAQSCGDGDGDGICDRDDQCRATPAGRRVMANGCHLEAAGALRLEGVVFASGSWRLNSAAKAVLARAAEVLVDAPSGRVEIAGHTDRHGSAEFNLALSQRRAEAVRRYLIEAGVSRPLDAKGYGESRPLSQGAEAGNRRVELHLYPE